VPTTRSLTASDPRGTCAAPAPFAPGTFCHSNQHGSGEILFTQSRAAANCSAVAELGVDRWVVSTVGVEGSGWKR
jgi:hypothetical protein